MSSLNRVELIWFLTEDPNLRSLPSWVSVADANLYVKTVVKNREWQMQEIWSYHNITLWRGLADVVSNYTRKWSQIFVAWRLETDSWEWEDGQKKYRTKVVADDLVLLSPKEARTAPEWFAKLTSWVNKADLIWNITNDLELRTTPSWSSVLSFWLATSRKWKNQQSWEYQEKTEFHNIVVWEKMAEELSEVAKKWSKLFISWRVQTRSWETPDGQKKYTTEVVADSIRLVWFSESSTSSDTVVDTKENSKPVEKSQWLDSAADDIPSIDYSTDIKPEDLPF